MAISSTRGARDVPNSGQSPRPIYKEGGASAIPFDFNNGRPRQMAGFARCPRCNHALTSLHVEAVPALGGLPAGSNILVVACPNCRTALGPSIIGPARTGARNRFHEASIAVELSRPATVGRRDCTAIARRRGALRPPRGTSAVRPLDVMFAGCAGGPPFRADKKNEGCSGRPSGASCTEGGPWESIAKLLSLLTSREEARHGDRGRRPGRGGPLSGASRPKIGNHEIGFDAGRPDRGE